MTHILPWHWKKNDPIGRAYVPNGLVEPPTRIEFNQQNDSKIDQRRFGCKRMTPSSPVLLRKKNQLYNVCVKLPKTNMDTQNDGLEKVTPLLIMAIFGMLDFWCVFVLGKSSPVISGT